MGTNILPRKVHALEGAQVPPLCVVQISETLFYPLSPGGSRKRFWSATQIPLHLLESLKVKVQQVRSMAASLAFHRQASMEQILRTDTWRCHNTFTDLYLKDLSLYSADLIQLEPLVAAESILHPTLEIIRGNIVYIPPSIHLDSAPCEATEPG